MHEVAQKLMSITLFSFQDLKLSTRDIITILKYTLNTTSGLLPIPHPHATGSHPTPWRDIQLVHVL
jgi:hypothetical protein